MMTNFRMSEMIFRLRICGSKTSKDFKLGGDGVLLTVGATVDATAAALLTDGMKQLVRSREGENATKHSRELRVLFSQIWIQNPN
jgi:hypothetical protein